MKTLFLTIAAIMLLCASCKNDKKDDDNASVFADQEQAVAEVDTISLSLQTFQKQILCNGRMTAMRKAELVCPKYGDVLQSVNVQNGQHVSAGQLLAVSDSKDKSAELDRARHDLERATVELQDKLIGLGYDVSSASNDEWKHRVPADVLRRAEVTSGYYSATFAVQSAQTALNACRLTAPFSGRIADLAARPYQHGDKFCTLIDDSYFDVEFKILEAELQSVAKGTKVKVSPFVQEDKVFDGTVTEVNPTVDERGLVKVVARVKNTDEHLIDGMNVKIIIENSVPNMMVVPKEAVVERDGYHVVFLYDAQTSRAVWTYVDIAYSNLTNFAITGCERKETKLHEGDVVIISGNLNLADDTEVRIFKEQ